MTFVQIEFLGFLALVFTLYWTLGNRVWQNALIAVASAVFYGWIHPWFLILLSTSAAMDYCMGRAMERWPERRRTWLVTSMCFNLGLLGWFKYFDFFVTNVITVFETLGVHTSLHTLGIFLPVGISFYTFQTMSYTIDVYRGKVQPRRNFLDYIVYVSFFPQLVAGPVERANRLLKQIEQDRSFDLVMIRSGVALAMWGAFKKVVVADTIAPYVDKAFILSEPSGPLIWAASVGFAVQILADFSGYTDIARGIARMLGIELVLNFDHPYLAVDPSDFWRRWHISFSTWIRDYLYIPLGGSRGTWANTVKATFGAMTLSGLWHGASWNFVLWGVYHAALITGYRSVKRRLPASWRASRAGHVGAVLLMFWFTCLGWMIFRETHIDRLLRYFTLNPFVATTDQWIATATLVATTAAVSTPLVLALVAERWVKPRLEKTPWMLPVQTSLWAAYAVAIFTFVRVSADDFIYFQF